MKNKIGFIGIGKLGLPCAEEMVKVGHNVIGYDTRSIPNTSFPITNSLQEVVKEREIIFCSRTYTAQ